MFDRSRKILRKTILTLFVLGSPVLVWWGWYEGCKIYDLYTGKMPMYDIRIYLQANGESTHIRRKIPCKKVYQSDAMPYLFTWNKRPWNAFPRDGSVGAELEDGRVVLFKLPSICRELWQAFHENSLENILPKDYIPVFAVLDKWPFPTEIQETASRKFYEQKEKEISILSYSISPSSRGNFPSFVGEFDWYGEKAEPSGKLKHRFEYKELIEVPVELLNLNTNTKKRIYELQVPTPLHNVEGFSVPIKIDYRNPSKTVGTYFNMSNAYKTVIPIIQSENESIVSPETAGMVRYYYVPPGSKNKAEGNSTQTGNAKVYYELYLKIGKVRIHVERKNIFGSDGNIKKRIDPLVYLPEKKKIYRLRASWRNFRY